MPKRNYERKRMLDNFFGMLNYKTHRDKGVEYKSVIDEDNIIIRTDNIRYINVDEHSVEPVLIVSKNKALRLKNWQYKKVSYIKDGKRYSTNIVKLKKQYFNPVWFINEFENVNFSYEDTWDNLYQTAIAQAIAGYYVYL